MDGLLNRTIEIIASHVAHNSVPHSELPGLIQAVHGSLVTIASGAKAPVEQPKREPAVPVKKSVHHDYLVSLEDGKRYQTLKRHLSALGMTPDEYRAKWGLRGDYPMTSASYSAKRSQMSKDLGLGRQKAAEPVLAPAAAEEPRPAPTAPVAADSAPEGVQNAPEAAREAA